RSAPNGNGVRIHDSIGCARRRQHATLDMMPITKPSSADGKPIRISLLVAATLYAVLLIAFWFAALHFDMPRRIHGHMSSSFAAFALLLAPYWFFGFGLADVLRGWLRNSTTKVLLPGVLVLPYLVFSTARGEFRWVYALLLFA